MRKTQQTPSQKQQKFRLQIRRRQIDQIFKVNRHTLPEMSSQDASLRCKQNFKQIQNILQSNQSPLYSNQRINILIKQLRQINCSHIVPQIFILPTHFNILIQLQNDYELNNMSNIHLHEILLNISSDDRKYQINNSKYCLYSNLTIQSLNLQKNLKSTNPQILILTLQIISNFIIKDQTSKTIYDIITKINIYKYLMKIIIDHKQIYNINNVKDTFLWFANKILLKTYKYKFQELDYDCKNFGNCVYEEVKLLIQNQKINKNYHHIQNVNGKQNQQGFYTINTILILIRTLIKTQIIEQMSQELLENIEKYFNPQNIHYLQFLGTLTSYTLYTLPLSHLEQYLEKLLNDPQNILSKYLVSVISNSLLNDPSNWQTVMNYFIRFSEQRVPIQSHINNHQDREKNQLQSIDYRQYGLLSYFMYFLNNSQTEEEMTNIIGVIICSNGGLGIFEDGLEFMLESACLRNKLAGFGYEIQY